MLFYFPDIEAKSDSTSTVKDRVTEPLWTRSDNSFKSQVKTSPSDPNEGALSQLSFSGQGSNFAFNFAIPEDMETAETAHSPSASNQQQDQKENPPLLATISTPSEVSAQPKTKQKKKKKSGAKEQPGKDPKNEPDDGAKEEEELVCCIFI